MKRNILNLIAGIGVAYCFIFIGMHFESSYGITAKTAYDIKHDVLPTIKNLHKKLQKELDTVQERNKTLGDSLSQHNIPPDKHITCIVKLVGLHENLESLTVYVEMYDGDINLYSTGQYEYFNNQPRIANSHNFPFKCWDMEPNKNGLLAEPENE